MEVSTELGKHKLVFFVLFLVGGLVVYYTKILSVYAGEKKTFKMMKQLLYVLILVGIISILVSTKSTDLKIMLAVVITSFVNIYNINHSTKKCNYPSLYKLKLYIKSTIFIIVLSFIVYYSNEKGGVFNFLYVKKITGDDDDDKVDVKLWESGATSLCPDPDKMDKTLYDTKMAGLDATAKPGKVSRALCEEVARRKELVIEQKSP